VDGRFAIYAAAGIIVASGTYLETINSLGMAIGLRSGQLSIKSCFAAYSSKAGAVLDFSS